MGKDCGSWVYEQKLSPWQSPNLNCGAFLPVSGQENYVHPKTFPAYGNMDSANRIIPGLDASEVPQLKLFSGYEPQVWHHCYGYQISNPKSMLGEKHWGETMPNQKRFVVFDHSANRTSLIFSSVGHPLINPFSGNLEPNGADLYSTELRMSNDAVIPGSVKDTFQVGGFNEHQEPDVSGPQSTEMHEDTEEINALLYSDEEDEETSTGHSPSEMTGHKREDDKDIAEVASCSLTPTKRRRLNGECDPSLLDTASSGKSWKHEDDAESSCIKGKIRGGRGVRSASKRLRRERIREAVCILSNIIPGGKGKDATAVLDEAIRYLRSLRLKAKAL